MLLSRLGLLAVWLCLKVECRIDLHLPPLQFDGTITIAAWDPDKQTAGRPDNQTASQTIKQTGRLPDSTAARQPDSQTVN